MRNILKRISAVFVALTVLLSMMPLLGEFTAYATDTYSNVKIGDFTYDIYDDGGGVGSIWIKKYSGTNDQIVIPSSVQYQGVKYTGEITIQKGAFAGNTSIKKIAIPDGSDIMRGVFAGCTGLTEVAIGNNVEYIGTWDGGDGTTPGVFEGCSNLKTYRIAGTAIGSAEDLKYSGIGQDSSGNIYPGITVYTVKGSAVDLYIQDLNSNSKNGNKITLVYENDPYSNNTVNPGGDNTANPGGSNTANTGGGSNTSSAEKETKGKDGTAYGKGASQSLVERKLKALKSEKDPKGTVFNLLQARISKVTKKSLTLKWKKVSGARKYLIYGNKCGKTTKLVKLATAKGSKKVFKKVAGKKVKKGTYYKFIVVAIDSKGKVISTSKIVHAATKGGKVGNDKKVTTKAKKNKVSIKKGKTFKLKVKPVPRSGKLKVKRHRGIKYESSNPAIATVSAKGVIKGKKKGTCYVYAYAQIGVFAKIKVTVK